MYSGNSTTAAALSRPPASDSGEPLCTADVGAFLFLHGWLLSSMDGASKMVGSAMARLEVDTNAPQFLTLWPLEILQTAKKTNCNSPTH